MRNARATQKRPRHKEEKFNPRETETRTPNFERLYFNIYQSVSDTFRLIAYVCMYVCTTATVARMLSFSKYKIIPTISVSFLRLLYQSRINCSYYWRLLNLNLTRLTMELFERECSSLKKILRFKMFLYIINYSMQQCDLHSVHCHWKIFSKLMQT